MFLRQCEKEWVGFDRNCNIMIKVADKSYNQMNMKYMKYVSVQDNSFSKFIPMMSEIAFKTLMCTLLKYICL